MSTGPLFHIDPSAFVPDPDLLGELKKRATRIPCETDRVLFRQGDPPAGLFIVAEGEAEVSMVSRMERTIFSVRVGRGSLLGLPGAVSDQPYAITAMALAGATVDAINQKEFLEFMQSESMPGMKLLEAMASRVRMVLEMREQTAKNLTAEGFARKPA
jgi:CRP-like cAMP-binding protein